MSNKQEKAHRLLMDYARRTGIVEGEGGITQRYLGTDAFAVQGFFALAHIYDNKEYEKLAVRLIDAVHGVLGKFHKEDSRKGWISGLSESEGKEHPTVGGLRIGKEMPERGQDEPFNSRLEWDRDGQYFHYITRWIHSLLLAERETDNRQYAIQALELLKACEKFIDRSKGLRMYWKMSTDLSRPLVSASGAHDPLEGLICAESILDVLPEKEKELGQMLDDLNKLCHGQEWSTADALGTGSLLLNTLQASALTLSGRKLNESIQPKKLFQECLYGLGYFMHSEEVKSAPFGRLAFRECGLSLGLRAIFALKDRVGEVGISLKKIERYMVLADEIENSWLDEKNQRHGSWKDHLDINAVTLACSIIAQNHPYVFCPVKVTVG
ncbi:hypothetical protein RCC89_15750 [Cytophagaceae bacterium ABcell3]|nr:hypothetical protein RCC89_15750 [Cytophagaceae bacterium ABcell3]